MSTAYVENATCVHCLKVIGTHNIMVRVDLDAAHGVHIGVDSLHFRPGLYDEICPRNRGGRHDPNQIAAIPQSFLDSVQPD